MLYVFCGAMTVGGYVTIVSSVITLILPLFDKDKKTAVKGPVIAFTVGILMVLLSTLILKLSQ